MTVTLMQCVTIPKDHGNALAIKVMKEMEHIAKVICANYTHR